MSVKMKIKMKNRKNRLHIEDINTPTSRRLETNIVTIRSVLA